MESNNGLIRRRHGASIIGTRQAVVVMDDRPIAEPKLAFKFSKPVWILIGVEFGAGLAVSPLPTRRVLWPYPILR